MGEQPVPIAPELAGRDGDLLHCEAADMRARQECGLLHFMEWLLAGGFEMAGWTLGKI